MANETKLSSLQLVAAYIDANIAPVLRANVVMFNLCHIVNFEKGSDSKKLRAKVAQTAAIVAEAAEATVAEYTQSTPGTLQAQKAVVLNEISEESEEFGGLTLDEVTMEQGLAIAEKIDTDTLALFAGFSNSVGSTGVNIAPAELIEAAYKARLANVPGPLAYVLHPIQTFDLQSAIVASAAPVWGNSAMIDLLNAQPNANSFRGNFMNIPVFDSSNCATANAGADRVGACINAKLAIALGVGRGTSTLIETDISKRTKQVSTDMYFDVNEYLDLCGCKIVTDA